jgi:hypothetical protein
MSEAMGANRILLRDALYGAAMRACDCLDLLSHGADFGRVL